MNSKTFFLALIILAFTGKDILAQTSSTFDEIQLAPNSFWNGSNLSGGFNSGNAFFKNYYDTAYYSWDGFSVSNTTDTSTSGWSNIYSAMATPTSPAENYSVVGVTGYYGPTYCILTGASAGKLLMSTKITNSVMAYKSMKDGDSFAKKFGGLNGTDPDWFMLTITGFNSGQLTDTVNFYLADFRFANTSSDYIIKDWVTVNLEKLGNVDSIVFALSSSDVGAWGMNTPAYFCVDDLVTLNSGLGFSIEKTTSNLNVYPNPANDYITLFFEENSETEVEVYNLSGKLEISGLIDYNSQVVDVSNLPAGIYFIKSRSENGIKTSKFIKK